MVIRKADDTFIIARLESKADLENLKEACDLCDFSMCEYLENFQYFIYCSTERRRNLFINHLVNTYKATLA